MEFSPYQKVPSEKNKIDSRIATVEEGALRVVYVFCCAIYINIIQTRITCRSSSRWRTTFQNHSTKEHLNI